MFDWETRLTTRDNNRVVRPFEWGEEWTTHWPLVDKEQHQALPAPEADSVVHERFFQELNHRIIANSDDFFSYVPPSDYQLSTRILPGEREATHLLEYMSPVRTPHPVNNMVSARWYPAKTHNRKAVILLPHWNSKPHSYIALCKILAKLGLSTLRLSLPYHDRRLPADTQRSDFAVSSNIGRTMDATRQAVIDARASLDWLQSLGYEEFGIVGTSL
ncbi:MAG TPA: hypothetical protein VM009_07310, partial [Terriglobales bacterium]|nr:hypothetical protein [Terriglobales bacterium]